MNQFSVRTATRNRLPSQSDCGLRLHQHYQIFLLSVREKFAVILRRVLFVALLAGSSSAIASSDQLHLTVYQDPNCGCCTGWVDHMRDAGFTVKAIKTSDVVSHKTRLGVPPALGSCHTAVLEQTGQVIEGHVPANVVRKMLTDPSVRGVAAPGMPTNAPGMGQLDGNLVTFDFNGRAFSRD